MARTNPQVEALRRENDLLRGQIKRMYQDPGDVPFVACDHSCVIATATGMSTNGGCRCDERKLRRAVQWWRRRAQFLQITLQDMRDGRVSETEPVAATEIPGPHSEQPAKGFD